MATEAEMRASKKWQSKQKRWTFFVPPSFADEVERYLKDTGSTLSRTALLKAAITEYMENHPNG